MKRFLIVLGLLTAAVTVRADGDFTKTLAPDELAATGLNKLTAEELARLKAVVERYKSGEVAVVQQQAEQKVAATEAKVKEAEQKVAAAEAKTKEAESKAAEPAADKKKPGWLKALVSRSSAESAEKQDHDQAIESRIAGEFSGWHYGTVFALENGQRWSSILQGDSYNGDTVQSPKVRIYPGPLGGYWMDIEGVRQRVKVKLVSAQ